MPKNTKEVELFGEKLILSERPAGDVLTLYERVKDGKTNVLIVYAIIIETALKNNIKEVPKLKEPNFIQKLLKFLHLYKVDTSKVDSVINFNKKLTSSYILSNLSQNELLDLCKQIGELEGIKMDVSADTTDTTDSKKK